MSTLTRTASSPFNTPEAIIRRKLVIDQIGLANLPHFEDWAFKSKTPVVYDNRIIFIWENAHSTKEDFSKDTLDESLMKMIGFWKGRYTLSEGFYNED